MSTTKIPQEHKANKTYEVKLLPSPQRSANLTFRNAIIVENAIIVYLTHEQNCCSVWNCCRLRHVTFGKVRDVARAMSCKSFDDSNLE